MFLNDLSLTKGTMIEIYNGSQKMERDCFSFNVEDADLKEAVPCVRNREWGIRAVGQSDLAFDILIIRNPYNLIASIVKLWGWDYVVEKNIAFLWKQHALEVLGETKFLGGSAIFVLFDGWFLGDEYRKMIAARLGITPDESSLRKVCDKAGGSSFDKLDISDARQMNVNGRWRSFYNDERFVDFFKKDPEITNLATRIFGSSAQDQAREILGVR